MRVIARERRAIQ